ncbi:mechanosensitive ion channel [candidate division WOR-3 bacterium]|nr:mechanosensitive ion channel [candidate division WOR-3 bacterium]
MEKLSGYLNISTDVLWKIIFSFGIFIFLTLLRTAVVIAVKRKIKDTKKLYNTRRIIVYAYTILLLLIIGPIWFRGFSSITTFLGLVSAGLAIALHDTIANIAGWLFIVFRKPFKVGDRIQIGDTAGDVIDIRLFQFSMVEIGNWVDADQSTGRILHVPNSKVMREPLANYHIGFSYIWNEVPVLVTFESDWRKAKDLLQEIVRDNVQHLSHGAEDQIRNAAEKYMIFYGALTPIIYTSVKESGVLLTIRYLVDPRQRRKTEQQIWEAVLDAFGSEANIELAYPTTRFYNREKDKHQEEDRL